MCIRDSRNDMYFDYNISYVFSSSQPLQVSIYVIGLNCVTHLMRNVVGILKIYSHAYSENSSENYYNTHFNKFKKRFSLMVILSKCCKKINFVKDKIMYFVNFCSLEDVLSIRSFNF